jgi:signal transduction histidine kinase
VRSEPGGAAVHTGSGGLSGPAAVGGRPKNREILKRQTNGGVPGLAAFVGLGVLVELLNAVVRLQVNAPEMSAMLETIIAAALIASTITLALLFRATRSQRHLLLLGGVMTLGLVDVISYAGPADLGLRPGPWLVAAPPVSALFAALYFGLGARVAQERVVGAGRRSARVVIAVALTASTLAELLGAALQSIGGVTGHTANRSVIWPVIVGGATLMGLAARELGRSRRTEGSTMMNWLAAGVLLLATALVDQLVTGPVAAGEITASVGLRLAAYTLIFVGLSKEALFHQRQAAVQIAQLERQRLAGDLHDGLCQDLAFIAAHGELIATESGEDHPLAIAARRALRTSRAALAELAPPADQEIGDALRLVSAELSTRFGIAVIVESDGRLELPAAERNDIVRIGREAIVNAAKHAGARNVTVQIGRVSGHVVMTVLDDGIGIAPPQERDDGFGMASMFERVGSLGGVLTAEACVGGGTELKVRLR